MIYRYIKKLKIYTLQPRHTPPPPYLPHQQSQQMSQNHPLSCNSNQPNASGNTSNHRPPFPSPHHISVTINNNYNNINSNDVSSNHHSSNNNHSLILTSASVVKAVQRYNRRNNPELEKRRIHHCDFMGESMHSNQFSKNLKLTSMGYFRLY